MIPHYLQIDLTPEEYEKFREKINTLRKKRNVPISKLAEYCNVSERSMKNYLYGQCPSKFTTAALANYFRIKQSDIVMEYPKKKGSFFGGWHIGIVLAIFAVPLTLSVMPAEKAEAKEIDYSKYIVEDTTDNEEEALGVMPDTEFVPGNYLEETVNPYPDAIVKYIEATAYCYGTTTCTGKPVRVGYAAMSKKYIGMTAIVYEADDNGNPLDYIGTYEIEDTGGDERIKNGNCIDIFMSSREECINFGRRNVVVYLIEAKG